MPTKALGIFKTQTLVYRSFLFWTILLGLLCGLREFGSALHYLLLLYSHVINLRYCYEGGL